MYRNLGGEVSEIALYLEALFSIMEYSLQDITQLSKTWREKMDTLIYQSVQKKASDWI